MISPIDGGSVKGFVMIHADHPFQSNLMTLAHRAAHLLNCVNALAESVKVRRIGTTAIALVMLLGFTQLRSATPGDIEEQIIQSNVSSTTDSSLPSSENPKSTGAMITVQATAHYDHTEPPKQFIKMEVTAYCPCKKCCGPNAQGITASGKPVTYNNGQFVAADTRVLPFGTKVVIPGYADEMPVEVTDRGGLIKGNKLDVYFDDHQTALEWGRRVIDVEIVEE